ncbi:MAG TPA: hypothetical protein VNZ03_24935 [Terriglobales bacterium]|nr:hypothetical protein [Terriglobales bacterium]
MAQGIASNLYLPNQTFARPLITSYDSGYEHSLDHYVDIKLLLQDADQETNCSPATFASAA